LKRLAVQCGYLGAVTDSVKRSMVVIRFQVRKPVGCIEPALVRTAVAWRPQGGLALLLFKRPLLSWACHAATHARWLAAFQCPT